jgi:hypothetical protein
VAGLSPAGELPHGDLTLADSDYSVSPRPAPVAGRDGRDWIVLVEIDAYQVPAS